MNVPLWIWAAVLGGIVAMLASTSSPTAAPTSSACARRPRGPRVGRLGVGFGVGVWLRAGAELGQQYFAGYLIEKSLAMDNVFVWAIIFAFFGVPAGAAAPGPVPRASRRTRAARRVHRRRRGADRQFRWMLYVFAAFLLWTGTG